MKRCCLFFLAFLTALLLAIMTGSFENRAGTVDKVGDTGGTDLASREKVKQLRHDHPGITESDTSKKTKP